MRPETFGELANTWGGDLRRWPEAVRAEARAFAEANGVEAERLLFAARQLDAVLDASPTPAVSMALRERVLASAAGAGLRARAAWPGLRRLLWVGGAGWAAAACAGVVFGLSLGGDLAVETQVDAVFDQAAMAGLDDTEVLG